MKSPTHLNALRAFEATARLGSYAAAGEEIGVTPEAIGQLVRGLEEYVGVTLFHRDRRAGRLICTMEARAVLPDLTQAMTTAGGVLQNLRSRATGGVLTVTAPPSFTALWLVPRLEAFRQYAPEVDIRLDVREALVDLTLDDAEVAIRYGRGDWQGVMATSLFPSERLFPVASPRLVAAQPDLDDPKSWRAATLIRDATIRDPSYPGWSDLLRKLGIFGDLHGRVIEMNAAIPAMEAAERGQGVALLREHLLTDALATGRLVRLGDEAEIDTGWTYYLLTRLNPSARANAFAAWITSLSDRGVRPISD